MFIGQGYGIVALALITLVVNMFRRVAVFILARNLLLELRVSRNNLDRTLFKPLFDYSKYTFIAKIGDILRFQIDALVIAQILGLSMVTHYNIAIRLLDYISQGMGAVLGIFQPVFTRDFSIGGAESLVPKFLFATRIAILFGGCAEGAAIIFGHPFIAIWMGEAYLDAYVPLAILGAVGILGVIQWPGLNVLYASANHKIYAWVNIIEGITNLTLSLVLIKFFGIIGVAIGTAIPFFI
ncbi:MAG: oligosaccharide flippase family protein, partial [Alphaproteobacteria bacterium]